MERRSVEWQERFCREQHPEACRIVIFGASGDLAGRKLFPSLAALDARGLLAAETRITGCARHAYDDASFRARIAARLPAPPDAAGERFLDRIGYVPLDYARPEDYRALASAVGARNGGSPLIFYLALPSALYPEVVRQLAAAGLLRETSSGGAR